MGQFALGLRSLLIKSALFVVMAALLAWALGGTLWPKSRFTWIPTTVSSGDDSYLWSVALDESRQVDRLRWRLVKWVSGVPGNETIDGRVWGEGAGPVMTPEGLIAYGGRDLARQWTIIVLSKPNGEFSMPDGLAVEQQLKRLENGLPLQDVETILRQRQAVLDPL